MTMTRKFIVWHMVSVNVKDSYKLTGLNKHVQRLQETPNANEDLTHLNETIKGSGNIHDDVFNAIHAQGATIGKKSVVANNHIVTASPEFFEDFNYVTDEKTGKKKLDQPSQQKWDLFKSRALELMEEIHGKENVVSVVAHFDEQTPHLHITTVPIVEKTIKRGKHKGEKRKVLSAREIYRGKYENGQEEFKRGIKMRKLQDQFGEKFSDLGLERGREKSKATHKETSIWRAEKKKELEKEIDTAREAKIEGDFTGFISVKKANEQIISILEDNKALKTQNEELNQENVYLKAALKDRTQNFQTTLEQQRLMQNQQINQWRSIKDKYESTIEQKQAENEELTRLVFDVSKNPDILSVARLIREQDMKGKKLLLDTKQRLKKMGVKTEDRPVTEFIKISEGKKELDMNAIRQAVSKIGTAPKKKPQKNKGFSM